VGPVLIIEHRIEILEEFMLPIETQREATVVPLRKNH
jgi:hypothetical protein